MVMTNQHCMIYRVYTLPHNTTPLHINTVRSRNSMMHTNAAIAPERFFHFHDSTQPLRPRQSRFGSHRLACFGFRFLVSVSSKYANIRASQTLLWAILPILPRTLLIPSSSMVA